MLTPFILERPETLQEALKLTAQCDCRVVNGGTDVLIQIRAMKKTASTLISLKKIDELKRIQYQDGNLFVGSGATLSAIQRDSLVCTYCPVLMEGVSTVGSPQIRNVGTLGGNVGTASPGGDGLTALIAENAFAEVYSAAGSRLIPVSELVIGPKRTALQPDEIIRGFYIYPEDWTFAKFFKIGRRNSLAISIVNGAVKLKVCNGIIEKASITVGAVAVKPFHVTKAEQALEGRRFDGELKEYVRNCVCVSVSPISDIRATADYRRYIAGIQCARLVEQGWEAAQRG